MLQLSKIKNNSVYISVNKFTEVKSLLYSMSIKDFCDYKFEMCNLDKNQNLVSPFDLKIMSFQLEKLTELVQEYKINVNESMKDKNSFYHLVHDKFDKLTDENFEHAKKLIIDFVEYQITLLTIDYNEYIDYLNNSNKNMGVHVDFDADMIAILNSSINMSNQLIMSTNIKPVITFKTNHIYSQYLDNIDERLKDLTKLLNRVKYNFDNEIYDILLNHARTIFLVFRQDRVVGFSRTILASTQKLEALLDLDFKTKIKEELEPVYKKDAWLTGYYLGEKFVFKTTSIDEFPKADISVFKNNDRVVSAFNNERMVMVRFQDLTNISVLKSIKKHYGFNNVTEVAQVYNNIYSI